MAIDFMILPMSRYISGDFVTPIMRSSWEQGLPYSIIGPNGHRDCPPGVPFGGVDARARRAAIQGMLHVDLKALPPAIAHALWDEHSPAEPRFHRVDPVSYEALLDAARTGKPQASFFGFLKRRQPTPLHVTATLFVPCDFDEVISMSSPFERQTGSVKRALDELASGRWPADAQSAREALIAALVDADALCLPLIVDW